MGVSPPVGDMPECMFNGLENVGNTTGLVYSQYGIFHIVR